MFHFGSPVNDWPRAVAQLPAGYVIKAIDNVQMLAEAKAVNPGVKTDLRHWYDPGQVFGGNDAENRNRARQFFDTFIDGTFMDYAHAVDYVEEFNEYNANSHNADEIADRVRWTEAVAWVWHYEYRTRPGLEHIQLILCNTAIGNDIHVGQAATAMTYNCLLGYHPYWPVKNNYTPDEEWEWYSGRWTAMDYKFLSLGVLVEWAFTEAGAVRYWNDWPNIGLDPMGGWKHPECHNSNLVEYKNGIARWMNKWQDWNTLHGDRALPPVLFDSRPGHTEWDHFQIQQPEMDEIAQLAQQWQPGNPAPPPPPPPPPEDRGKPRIQYPRVYNVIPQDATEARAVEIFRLGWNEAKQTSGGSYDDAGVGDLDNRTAVLWDIPADKQEVYRAWFATWYAGTHVEFASGGNPEFFLVSPVEGIPLQVTSAFGVPRSYGPHEGLDLRAKDAAGRSVLILAVADGDVTWASNLRRSSGQPSDYGNHVIIQHDNGLISWSCHLANMTVQAGDRVLQGQVLGLAGSTGNSTGVHLHLTIQWPGHGLSGYIIGDALDPAPLLGL